MASGVTVRETEIDTADYSGRPAELLSDAPIRDLEQDHLDFYAYAEALAALIDSPSVSTPLTMSINAPWGAGKTSLARLMEQLVRVWPQARGQSAHLVVWFNAWMHSDAPNIGAALAAAVAKTTAQHRRPWRRVVQWVPSSMLSPDARQRRRVIVLIVAVGLALFVASSKHFRDLFGLQQEEAHWAGLGVIAAVPIAAALLTVLLGVARSAASFINDPSAQAATGAMGEVGDQFARLVRAATPGHRRLVIFIDDLDRCSPDRALQVCETASLLLAVPGVVTVLLGDLAALRTYAVEHLGGGNAAGAGADGGRSGADPYSRSFLDKIVQLDFALPHSQKDSLYRMLTSAVPAATETRPTERGTVSRALGAVGQALNWLYDHVCGRPRRYFAFLAITVGITIVLATVLTSIDNGNAGWENAIGEAWFIVMFVAWCVAGIGTVISSVRRRNKRKLTAQLNEEIRTASVETLTEAVTQAAPGAQDRLGELREQLERRDFIERQVRMGKDELFGPPYDPVTGRPNRRLTAEQKSARKCIPAVPRAAKRMLNRYYLLTSVAVSRKMLGPDLTSAQLVKWALILERWPEVADLIISEPGVAEDVERAAAASTNGAGGDPWTGLLDTSAIPDFDELLELLRVPPMIGGVAERLVFAQPAASRTQSNPSLTVPVAAGGASPPPPAPTSGTRM